MSVTTTQFILMVLAIIAMVWGLYAILRSWQAKQNPSLHLDFPADNTKTGEANPAMPSKDGVPIVPRHERRLSEENPEENSTEETLILEKSLVESSLMKTPMVAETSQNLVSDNVALNTQAGTTTTITAEGDIYVNITPKADITNVSEALQTVAKTDGIKVPTTSNEPDAFSALANATVAITPVVHTFDETQFKQAMFDKNSPILDSHIQAQIDQEQNSPLHNAEQNINISIFPHQHNQRFVGRDLLDLVDKYGLKYGAMNMFHRYENKDGTGILWFSMMMVDEEGPSPFDLNKLPLQHLDGLILFLSLPHPEAGQAFESMISMAKMMANDLKAELYDDVGEPLSGDSIALLKSTAVSYDRPL